MWRRFLRFLLSPWNKHWYLNTSLLLSYLLIKQAVYIGENYEKCLGNYLNKTGNLESNFKVDPFIGSSVMCRIMINVDLSIKFYSFGYFFASQNFTKIEASCMQSEMSGPDYVEYYLKTALYNRSTKMPKNEIEAKTTLLSDWFNDRIKENLYKCRELEEERWFFNHIFNISRYENTLLNDNFKTIKEFCFKQYMLKEKLLQSDFNLTMEFQPISDIFCRYHVVEPFKNEAIALLFWTFFGLEKMDTSKKMCAIDLVEKFMIIEKLTGISAAAAFGMNDEQKDVELKHFDRLCRQLYKSLNNNCFYTK